MRRHAGARSTFALVLVTAAVARPVEAQEPSLADGLSLGDAIALAQRHNPVYQATRNDLEVADWDVRSAWASLLPSASVSSGIAWQGAGQERFGSITFGEQPSFYFSNYNAGLSLRLDGSAVLAPGEARASRDATLGRIRTEEATLVLDVTRAYLEVLRQRESRQLAERELERARLNLRLARGQEAVGAVSPLDVRQAEVAVGRA
ncbi:MAG: TolC family protein, partial [Gemmatimonadetes bacterium]|nr:TolC family protein [Gemmatimonadota bacterium]